MKDCKEIMKERARVRQLVLECLINKDYRRAARKHQISLGIDKAIDILGCKN